MEQLKEMTAEQVLAGSSVLLRPAEEFENDPAVEAAWVVKAVEHAEVYFNILCSVDPKFLKLTPHDDHIYKAFKDTFPDLKVDKINEEEFKSAESKNKWRPFCEQFKNVVEDYSFGTLLRADCTEEYTEKNSILTSRIQFYAIELTRNREGLNDGVRKKFKAKRTVKN